MKDETFITSESICIFDFTGSVHFTEPVAYSYQTNVSAGYFPDEKYVVFYGAWGNIPAMPCDYEPNKDEIFEWVKKHNNGELFSAWGFNKK